MHVFKLETASRVMRHQFCCCRNICICNHSENCMV